MDELVFKLGDFEGPLDLLLSLVEKKKVRIEEVQLSPLIDEYIDTINEAKEENIDLKSDFVVFASELLEIKSNIVLIMSLPQKEEKIAPEEELRRRLIEYKILKEMAKKLSVMENMGNVSFSRKESRERKKVLSKEYTLKDLTAQDLFRTFYRRIQENKPEIMDLVFEKEYYVDKEAYSIFNSTNTEKITLYENIFMKAESKVHFIYLFLAVLELYRNGYVEMTETGILSTGKKWSNIMQDEDEMERAEDVKSTDNIEKKQKNKKSTNIKIKKDTENVKNIKNKKAKTLKKVNKKESQIKEAKNV